MHEVLFTRGNVQGMDQMYRELIHTKYNCVLVHNYKCHTHAHFDRNKIACVMQIIKFEGGREVAQWVVNLRAFGVFPEELLHGASSLVHGCIANGS